MLIPNAGLNRERFTKFGKKNQTENANRMEHKRDAIRYLISNADLT